MDGLVSIVTIFQAQSIRKSVALRGSSRGSAMTSKMAPVWVLLRPRTRNQRVSGIQGRSLIETIVVRMMAFGKR